MKYRLTPFHFLTIAFLVGMFIIFIDIRRYGDTQGFGAFGSMVLFVLGLLALGLDLLLQYLFYKSFKYVIMIEVAIILAGIILVIFV